MPQGGKRHGACRECLAHSWLLARLSGHLDAVRAQIGEVLALSDRELIEAVAGKGREAVAREYDAFRADQLRQSCAAAGLEPVCRCDSRYPARLLASPAPPALLHVAGGLDRFGELAGGDPVAVVGARRASSYGLEVARALGRGLAAADVVLVSGMAFGIDSAAHAAAVDAGGRTIAVLPGGADRAYPRAKRALWRRISDQRRRDLGAAAGDSSEAVDVSRTESDHRLAQRDDRRR